LRWQKNTIIKCISVFVYQLGKQSLILACFGAKVSYTMGDKNNYEIQETNN